MRTPISTSSPFNNSSSGTIFLIIIFLLSFTVGHTQTNVWTWVSGDNTGNNAGVYGTKSVAAATNKPGNRDGHSAWKDASGNFWIFGGWDIIGNYYNDLWKYNTSTGQWTWVSGDNTTNISGVYGTKGTAGATNEPGSRYGQSSWVDASGNFWIYGGSGIDAVGSSGLLNDLWKYNPTTGQWTWVSGDNTVNNSSIYGTKGTAAATNKPGGRYMFGGWIDASGNFWIIGGNGYDATTTGGYLNDLWKYNTSTGQWTWISGDNTRNNSGTYGTKGTAAAANKPGGRYSHNGWVDASGNFWVFAGSGYDRNGSLGSLNDLWKYNTSTGQWTWISGDNTRNNSGVYGTKGTGAATNKPGGRQGQNVVIDGAGNFWLYSGYGYDGSGNLGVLNDLWSYKPSTDIWTWQSGDNTRNSTGVYGTKGTGAASNKSGGRGYAASWLDAAGNLWSFGGYDMGANDYNDLWQFNALSALPIRKISIQGNHRGNDNYLSWETIGEINTDRFVVERSENGITFTSIGTVNAAGRGNNHYSYLDIGAANSTFYYRIQVIDKDANIYYSPLVLLTNTNQSRLRLYPNPARNTVILETDNSLLNTPVKIYDASGRLAAESKITMSKQRIDITRLAKGVITLTLNNGNSFTIIKE